MRCIGRRLAGTDMNVKEIQMARNGRAAASAVSNSDASVSLPPMGTRNDFIRRLSMRDSSRAEARSH
jgi:hypothetical protein